ncbi:MAG: radical SAM protein [Sphingomonadaceae bacterium]|nr:radical SAM protein [Sphingomonadaceae bacterium]
MATKPLPGPSPFEDANAAPLPPEKFRDPRVTAKGEARAHVALGTLETLWFNTGTLCNLACKTCYIESSPTNDALVYLSLAEVEIYLDEIERNGLSTREIGFTGGEPFMNPDMIAMLESCLSRGFEVLVLSNAMRPMRRFEEQLRDLRARYGDKLTIRVSLDHYTQPVHEGERGAGAWDKGIDGLKWLSGNRFSIAVAGRHLASEDDAAARRGFAALFAAEGIDIDADDPMRLVLFPEMDATADVPEITTACWGILDVDPRAMMCASSRMVVKHRGADAPVVAACTLLPYGDDFQMGATLAEASRDVQLNHPHCAQFCVLGGASCSG